MNRSALIIASIACLTVTAAPAGAGDVAGSRHVAAAKSAYNWTGFYAGVHAGYGLGNTDFGNSDFGALDIQGKGGIGGIQLGYNQQVGNILFGIEGDFSFAGVKGERSITNAPVTITQNSKIKWLSTLTGRAGLTNGPWLTYAKAGLAWAKLDYGYLVTVTAPAETMAMSTSEKRSGWIVGAGVEYALANQWSVRGEYNFINFADRSFIATGADSLFGPTQTNGHAMQNLHLVKLGLNYQLGGPKNTNTIEPAQYTATGYDWSGIYIGGQFGYGSAKTDWRDYDPLGGYSSKSGLAGAQIGANVQVGALVLGVEAELLGGNIKGSTTFLAAPTTITLTSKADWLAMATARVGFATNERWLPYLKLGVAAMNDRHAIDIVQTGVGFANFSAQRVHTGLVIGGGLEYAFAKNWSARMEYDYIDFGTETVVSAGVINAPPLVLALFNRNEISTSMHLAKLGINYHFAP
jgi:opacity protein-like surface antigen